MEANTIRNPNRIRSSLGSDDKMRFSYSTEHETYPAHKL